MGARLLQLRAAMSMARLRRDQRRLRDGYEVLARACAGLPSDAARIRDVAETAALLDELRQAAGVSSR
jgi:hypothetical protein